MAEHVEYENVTIASIDLAVTDWFDKTVDAHVEDPAGARKKVPVNFSAGERWASSRARRGTRDKNGVLILPIVSVRRTGIEPTADSALGTETPTLQIARRISGKTNALQNLDKLRSPSRHFPAEPVVFEVTSVPFPDRSVMTYDLSIQAQYIKQMNQILEKIFNELDLHKSFVAPLHNAKRHPPIGVDLPDKTPLAIPYVVGYMESNMSDGGNFEEFTDVERIVKFSTSIRVPAVLLLDPEGERPALRTERTSFAVSFGAEDVRLVDDPRELELIFGSDE